MILNGSSKAKRRLSGAVVSTKNSFIDPLSPSYSLNLGSLIFLPPLFSLTAGIILFLSRRQKNSWTHKQICTHRLCHAVPTVSKEPPQGLKTVSLIEYQRGRFKLTEVSGPARLCWCARASDCELKSDPTLFHISYYNNFWMNCCET